ncbi:MAG: hypothetical protein JW703_00880, partial [Candidatus Diapherotrites archaeon]|nr:hypothetical protein [Candidatus Diapherotrites archaeon]
SFQPTRVVIDSLTTLSDSLLVSGLESQKDYSLVRIAESVSPIPRSERIVSKNLLYHLMKKLRLFNSTILLTSELPEDEKKLSADGISEFICDGVMLFEYLSVGESVFRNMRVRKMRYTSHEKGSLPYSLGKDGVEIKEKDLQL